MTSFQRMRCWKWFTSLRTGRASTRIATGKRGCAGGGSTQQPEGTWLHGASGKISIPIAGFLILLMLVAAFCFYSLTNSAAQAKTTEALTLARENIQRHEGWSPLPYEDAGGQSIGFGTRLPLRPSEGLLLMDARIYEALEDARMFAGPDWAGLNNDRQAVLIEMAYQLGRGGLLEFERMRAALHRHDWHRVYEECLDSEWGRSHKQRAIELAEMMRGQ